MKGLRIDAEVAEKMNKSQETLDRKWKNYLLEFITHKTSEKQTLNKIESRCGFSSNTLSKFPVKREKLNVIIEKYALDEREAKELLNRNGLSVSLPSENPYLEILKLVKNLDYTQRCEREEYVDTKFDYKSMIAFRETLPNSLPDLSEEEIRSYYKAFHKTISDIATNAKWQLIAYSDFLKGKSAGRMTLYELGFLAGFGLEEMKELYKIYGYKLSSKYIPFDAFVKWIYQLDYSRRYRAALYKDIYFTRNTTKDGKWQANQTQRPVPDHRLVYIEPSITLETLLNPDRISPELSGDDSFEDME